MFLLKSFLLPLLVFLSLTNCNNQQPKATDSPPETRAIPFLGEALDYSINQPSSEANLIRDLREISGLTYNPRLDQLMCINDEKAFIYFLDTDEFKMVKRIDFGKSRDYEGIAYKDGEVYIVESNGDFFVVNEETEKRTDKFNTKLSRKNDIEGLTYQASKSQFLVAAKGEGKIDGKSGKVKSIFILDPAEQKIEENPFVSIDLEEEAKKLEEALGKNEKVLSNYQLSRIGKFSPSGIAIHPVTKDIFILSSRGKLLVVLDQASKIKGIHFLDEQLHKQPEGICFSPTATLFVSNEGRAGKAKIYKYDMIE